jgi:hypothetical protein
MSIILSQLFPKDSINLQQYHPVSWTSLVNEVLLPEATVALIQEDLTIDRKEAIVTMRRSQQFGSALHPGDDSSHVKQLFSKFRHVLKL